MKPWRHAVRAVILDDADRVLLVHFALGVHFEGGVWATPGGGVDPGESDEQALRRELAEEVGLTGFVLGPCLWTRAHAFEMPEHRGQRERVFLVRSPGFAPTARVDLTAEGVTELRWWSRRELATATVRFAPRRLPAILADLLDHGPPRAPIDSGV